MEKKHEIKLFEHKKVRTLWDEEQEKWYFSIVDVIAVLTDQPSHQGARNYWKVLKNRLLKEGNETVTNCNQLKLRAEDGKLRLTDVGNVPCSRSFSDSVMSVFFTSHLQNQPPKF
jgi:hypothetical protein